MCFSRRIGLVIFGLLFAGCSGNAPSAFSAMPFAPGNTGALTPQTRDQLLVTPPAAGTDDLYVSAFYLTDIADYHMPNKKGRFPYCTITGPKSINGIGVDRNGVLWVPQEQDQGPGIVTSYAPGCGAPGITLTGNSQPLAIAFGPKGGKLRR